MKFFLGLLVTVPALLLTITMSVARAHAADLPGEGADRDAVVVYRDTWGVPHIYAPTVLGGMYAQGWAMAEDRPVQLLRNMLRARGELAAVDGRSAVLSDLRSHMFDHYGVAQRHAYKMPQIVQEHMKAFMDGVNDYYAAHPEDAPEWWSGRTLDWYSAVAWGRLFLYNWSIDEAYADLRRGGIEPGYDRVERGSNQWAVSPWRSANGAAILCIDPHLSWWGPSRFWEVRFHAGDLEGSGVTLPGSPYIGLGHNANVAWAMTTGGPDTADVYALTLKDDDPTKYLYDGEWRSMTKCEVVIEVKDEEPQTHTLWYSHHGPIIAMRDGKAYAAKMSYAETANVSEAWYHLNFAKDFHGAVRAMETLAVFPQNVMVADTKGNIYYQRTGRTPKRPAGYDWTVPVDGSTSKTEWQGIHPASDHLQVLNPPHGYMQNCNIPPDAMMVDSVFSLDKSIPYIYGSRDYGPRDGWTNQRGARALEVLSVDDSMTIDDALALATDVRPYGAERWIEALRQAAQKHGAQKDADPELRVALDDLLGWDGAESRDSTGALKYYYWRKSIADLLDGEEEDALKERIDHFYAIVQGDSPPPVRLTDDQLAACWTAFETGMAELAETHGSYNAAYGDTFRVGRDKKSWPVGGGGDRNLGTRTLRSIGYGSERDDGTRWGRSGQTSTQVVVLTKPIQSWIYLPVGQSDRPDSPHYDDQAEKLFSKRQLKPSWWTPEALAEHIESRTVIESAPR